MSYKTRNSSIELLKIISMILIVMSHSLPTWIPDVKNVTNELEQFGAVLIAYGGSVGNAIFIVCSAYFLVEDKAFKLKKILYVYIDAFIISVLWLCTYIVMGGQLSVEEGIKQFFSVTFNYNWFIGCYVIYFAIHSLLNMIIEELSKWQLLQMNSILFVVYCGINLYWRGSYYYTDLVGFICIHFWMAYMKKYLVSIRMNKRFNLMMVVLGCLGLIILIGGTNILGFKLQTFEVALLKWNQFINPFIIMIAFGVVNFFATYQWSNTGINNIAKLSLLVYLISENYIWRTYIRAGVWDWLYYECRVNDVVLGIGVMTILQGGLALVVGIIYKGLVSTIVYNIGLRIFKIISKVYTIGLKRIYEFK